MATAAGTGGGAGEGGAAGSGTLGPTCGNATLDSGEECDDGNLDEADGCSTHCQWGITLLVGGYVSTCAIWGNGKAKCWGGNALAQLGQGDTNDRGDQPGELGAALGFIKVGGREAAFSSLSIVGSACGVVASRVWCWGSNGTGQLGQGFASESINTPVLVDTGPEPVKSVSVGHHFACALLESGDVKCWGRNVYGALGTGAPTSSNAGDEPGEMGASLIVSTRDVAQLTTYGQHVCVVHGTGTLECWGNGTNGQTGRGDNVNGVNLGPSAVVTQVVTGNSHTCALLAGQLLKCFGGNANGELGYGDTLSRGLAPEELGAALPAVPIASAADPIASLLGLFRSTCVVTRSGAAKCWGLDSPDDGRLGQPRLVGALGNIGDQPGELAQLPAIDLGPGAVVGSLAGGHNHVCALLGSGEVKCWGYNDVGQLGIGHTTSVGTQVAQMGAKMQAVPLR